MASTFSLSNEFSKEFGNEKTSMSDLYSDDLIKRIDSITTEVIEKNNTVLGTYRVISDPISGGMGSVWRVHHNSWNADLAMKRPQPRYFAEGSDERKMQFVKECEYWIDLGLHPNIVSCYYVREIGGVPTIFSEWMEGGSLKDRIADGSLYNGTEEQIRQRILDIAIQAARGLQYSHENGLIHQDMKPGNLLLSKDWEAKVADFGLAKAKEQLDNKSEKAKTTGGTLAYCPKEQRDGEEPARWMDVYAWALTVLAMYEGNKYPFKNENGVWEYPWLTGAEAKENLDKYFSKCRYELPEEMRKLLRSCLNDKPDSFDDIENKLVGIYREAVGKDYHRIQPKAAENVASSLNNKALSYLDLGKPKVAERCWNEAIRQNAAHIESLYNLSLLRWRRAEIDDVEALNLLNPCRQSAEYERLISKIELERGNPEGVIDGAEETDREFAKALPKTDLHSSGSEYPYTSLLTSPDGSRLLAVQSVGENNVGFELYDPLHEKPCKVFRTKNQADTAFSGFAIDWDGDRFAILEEKKQEDRPSYNICIYELNSLELMCKLSVDSNCGAPSLFSPDGTRIYTREGTAVDSGSGDVLGKIAKENDLCSIYDMAISSDGKILVVSWNTKQDVFDKFDYLCLYDAFSLTRMRARRGQRSMAININFVLSPDDSKLYYTDNDETVYTWNIRFGNINNFIMGPNVKVFRPGDIALNKDGSLLAKKLAYAEGVSSGILKLNDTEKGRCLRSVQCESKQKKPRPWMLQKSAQEHIAFLGDRFYIAKSQNLSVFSLPKFGYHAGWALSKIEKIDQRLEKESLFLFRFGEAEKAFRRKAYAEALNKLGAARRIEGMYNDPRSLKLNRDIGAFCRRLSLESVSFVKKHRVDVMCSRNIFSKDGKSILSIFKDKAYLIDTLSGVKLQTFTPFGGNKSKYNRLGASMNADATVVCLGDGYLYDVSTGQIRSWLEGHDTWTCSAGFSPDGTLVATGGEDGRFFINRTDNGSLVCEFDYGKESVLDICFLSDGDTLLVSAIKWTIDLVSISQKKIIRRFSKDTGLKSLGFNTYRSYSVSPDGKTALVNILSYGYIMLDLLTGEIIDEAPDTKYISAVHTGFEHQLLCMTIDDIMVFIPSLNEEPEIKLVDSYRHARALAVSPDLNYAAVNCGYADINVYALNWKYSVEPVLETEALSVEEIPVDFIPVEVLPVKEPPAEEAPVESPEKKNETVPEETYIRQAKGGINDEIKKHRKKFSELSKGMQIFRRILASLLMLAIFAAYVGSAVGFFSTLGDYTQSVSVINGGRYVQGTAVKIKDFFTFDNVELHYAVDGTDYTAVNSLRFGALEKSVNDSDDLHRTVHVFYDPDDPEKAYVTQAKSHAVIWLIVFSLPFAVGTFLLTGLIIGFIAHLRRQKKKTVKRKARY